MEDLMQKIEELRRRIFDKRDFRELLVKDPTAALKEVGITATPQNLALVKNVTDSINNLYSAFEEKDEFCT
jgi:hypothetical protein